MQYEESKLKSDINKLKRERARLTKIKVQLNADVDLLKYGAKEANKLTKLTEGDIENLSKSIVPVTCALLRSLPKRDIIEILLLRETLLYNKMHEFEDSLKNNDKFIFKTLREEVKNINAYLIDRDKAYWELVDLKQEVKELKLQHKKEMNYAEEMHKINISSLFNQVVKLQKVLKKNKIALE